MYDSGFFSKALWRTRERFAIVSTIMSELSVNGGGAMSCPQTRISGLYRDSNTGNELRLDVDGDFPQMMASGTFNTFLDSVHWLADLTVVEVGVWEGNVVYKHPSAGQLPFSAVRINAPAAATSTDSVAAVTFLGSVPGETTTNYNFISPYFHPVAFEFDVVEGTEAVTSIETHAHPNRPGALMDETLTIEEVYRRSGFDASVSTDQDGVVPLSFATTEGELPEDRDVWDDNELHDAMQSFWSRFENQSQWALWVVYASLHEADEPSVFDPDPQPEDLGGIMFDDIGPNHRQGTAIFNDAFISNPSPGDPAPDAWVRRMRFWTAVHEMGHAFNLAAR